MAAGGWALCLAATRSRQETGTLPSLRWWPLGLPGANPSSLEEAGSAWAVLDLLG